MKAARGAGPPGLFSIDGLTGSVVINQGFYHDR